ncbi:MAG: hypothetical protein Ct9H300mP13_5180 [Gammaproteobacteria bacterium]|nr:MAG: hypothetical protein Ct9H300mP13_5180 [Gammaproteobacteria bacterium]
MGNFRTFFPVIIPLAKIGIFVAAVFCFILSFGDFVSPITLADQTTHIEILIIDPTKSGQQWPRARLLHYHDRNLFAIMFTPIALAYRRRS